MTIPLDGLTSATRYRYHVLVGQAQGEALTVATRGEFTTLPDAANSTPVTFAWSGDLGGQGRCRRGAVGYPIFDVMRAQQLDFFLFLGDTIYGDSLCPSPPNEPGADFRATTLAEYRARHRDQRGAEALRRFLDSVPVYVIWDDHEVRNNFAGPFDSQMPVGRQALREYWPIRVASDDPHRLYRTVRAGADLELFILDTRQYRSRNADQDGPAKTMLGERQLQWLLSGLTESTATWKVIVTTVPLSISKGGGAGVPGNDGWAGGADGTRVRAGAAGHCGRDSRRKMKNVVFLAGDVHYVQANAYDPNGDGTPDFHEFIAGPLSAAPGPLTPPSAGLHPTTLMNEGGYYEFWSRSSHEVHIRCHSPRRGRSHAVFPPSARQVTGSSAKILLQSGRVASYGNASLCVVHRGVLTRFVMLLQLISMLGALMVLSAYGLIQGGVWRELNAGYLALNIVGSLLLGLSRLRISGSDSFSWSLRGPALDWSA